MAANGATVSLAIVHISMVLMMKPEWMSQTPSPISQSAYGYRPIIQVSQGMHLRLQSTMLRVMMTLSRFKPAVATPEVGNCITTIPTVLEPSIQPFGNILLLHLKTTVLLFTSMELKFSIKLCPMARSIVSRFTNSV